MSIKVNNLLKLYGRQKAVDGLSFEIGQGIVGFLGANGAGKSTTMKILAGLLPADGGDAFVQGLNVREKPLTVKRILGFLPENNPLYADMYVREILRFEADTHGLSSKKERIADVIARTGLESEQHKKVHQLSKGYKQRLGLAMSIIHDPEVLILDEPTSGLDPNQILEIRALIKNLGTAKTVLISTHILQEVEAICDEVIILHKGILKDRFALKEMPHRYPGRTLEEVFAALTS